MNHVLEKCPDSMMRSSFPPATPPRFQESEETTAAVDGAGESCVRLYIFENCKRSIPMNQRVPNAVDHTSLLSSVFPFPLTRRNLGKVPSEAP